MKNKHGNRSLPANRNYKDTIFRWLFSDKNNLLSLYNAIAGAHYQNPEALNIVTLENAVYMGMKNDLAFVLETGLYLYEHQSTYNPNIPLRDLFYIASEYQSSAVHTNRDRFPTQRQGRFSCPYRRHFPTLQC